MGGLRPLSLRHCRGAVRTCGSVAESCLCNRARAGGFTYVTSLPQGQSCEVYTVMLVALTRTLRPLRARFPQGDLAKRESGTVKPACWVPGPALFHLLRRPAGPRALRPGSC